MSRVQQVNRFRFRQSKMNTNILFKIVERLKLRVQIGDELEYKVHNNTKYLTVEGMTVSGLFDSGATLEKLRATIAIAIAHEIGHFLAAPLSRRNRKNFGIPLSQDNSSPRSRYKWEREEVMAQLFEQKITDTIGVKNQSKRLLVRKMKEYDLESWWKTAQLDLDHLLRSVKQ